MKKDFHTINQKLKELGQKFLHPFNFNAGFLWQKKITCCKLVRKFTRVAFQLSKLL